MRVADARRAVAVVLLLFPVLFTTQRVIAQPATTQAEITFQFEREALPVPRYTLRLHEDCTGSYQAEQAARSGDSWTRGEAAQHVDRTLTLSPAMTAKIFHAARSLDHFNVACASRAKNIADTGTKTLRYTGPDGSGSCIYNYTEDKTAMMLTDLFQAMAETLDEGRRLEFLHRYDRLGLDAEMSSFSQELANGHAVEPGMIASTLSGIADDPALIQRVRERAVKILQQARDSR